MRCGPTTARFMFSGTGSASSRLGGSRLPLALASSSARLRLERGSAGDRTLFLSVGFRAQVVERKRSYLTDKGLFSRKAVKGDATEPINFIKEESHGTRSTPHRHRT